MKEQRKSKSSALTAAVMCLGAMGITLIFISPCAPQNIPETISTIEETSYPNTEQTTLKIEISSPLAYMPKTEGETNEPEQQKPLHYNYTEADINMLAKLVFAEAGGCSEDEQRLVVWTVFQRVDSSDHDFKDMNTIEAVVTAPNQFAYYPKSPVIENIRAVCEAEISKWANFEQPPTIEPYAPTLPYLFFEGDGYHNWFRAEW